MRHDENSRHLISKVTVWITSHITGERRRQDPYFWCAKCNKGAENKAALEQKRCEYV